MTDTLEMAELLDSMAAVIEELGHCTGSPQDLDGRVCLLGAARVVRGVSVWQPVCEDGVVDWLDEVRILNNEVAVALGLVGRDAVWRLNDGCLLLGGTEEPLNKDTAIELLTNRSKELRNL